MNALQKIRSLHTDITTSGNGLKIVDAWTLAERLLSRMPCNQTDVKRICKEKDAVGLDALLRGMEHPQPVIQPALPEYPEEQLAAAMRAFKKRLKLMRLSDESKLGGRYTSGGHTSKIDAIQPPEDFPPQIWKVLAKSGKLVDTGRGFYAEP